MKTTVVIASASTVTLTATGISQSDTDADVIARAKRAAGSYGIAETGHRMSRVGANRVTTANPTEAVVTLDRLAQERAA